MKRDFALVQTILEHVEAHDSTAECRPPQADHFTTDEVCYHARLCYEAGFLASFNEVPSGDGRRIKVCLLGPLTWAGHEALAEMRGEARPLNGGRDA